MSGVLSNECHKDIKMRHRLVALLVGLAFIVITGCASAPNNWQQDISGLAQQTRALGGDVQASEADRLARIAYEYSAQLAKDYNVTDAPLIHNTKVNQGLRPRGLCWHWADDLEARLRKEGFQSLSLHRAIANSDNLLIQHSTVIVSAKGDPMSKGIVLDPWRYGGKLFWAPIAGDTRYRWKPRSDVFSERRARQ